MSVPVELRVTRWRCPTCPKSWSKKKSTQAHIDFGCPYDPAARSCRTCRHHDEGERGDWEEPGSPEGCDKGHEIESPLNRHCPDWEPTPWVARHMDAAK